MDELDKILAEEEEKKPDQDKVVPPKKEEPKVVEKDAETLKLEEHKENLRKAIDIANEELRSKRGAIKEAKKLPIDEDELPKIDLENPDAKAWDKHFSGKLDPLMQELEKERAEVRSLALREFLNDHPALAKSSDKVKELISTYDKLRTTTERVKEGVLRDLNRAYGAVNGEELIDIARKARIDQAREDGLLADVAISRGATSYSEDTPVGKSKLNKDDRKVLKETWHMTDEDIDKIYG